MFAKEYEQVLETLKNLLPISVVAESSTAVRVLAAGKAVLLVNPPAITFQTYTVWESEYRFLLLAPRKSSNMTAATTLSDIIETLAANLPGGIESARPDDYEFGDQYYVQGYEITYKGE